MPPTPTSCGGEGRIRTSEDISQQIYSLSPLTAREPPQERVAKTVFNNVQDGYKQEPMRGIEPPTCRLQIGCSAIELHRRRRHPHATARREREGKINKMASCVNNIWCSFRTLAVVRTQALRKPISGGSRQPPNAKPLVGQVPRRQHVEPIPHRRSHA